MMLHTLRRHSWAAGVLVVLCLAPAAFAGNPPLALDCRAAQGAEIQRWQVELDVEFRQARVDGTPVPAEFGNSHARLRLADGRTLFIGLASGRLLLGDAEGRTLAKGGCVAGASA